MLTSFAVFSPSSMDDVVTLGGRDELSAYWMVQCHDGEQCIVLYCIAVRQGLLLSHMKEEEGRGRGRGRERERREKKGKRKEKEGGRKEEET